MNRLHRILPVFAAALFVAVSKPSKGEDRAKPQQTPNVVIIFADDLGYGDVGAFNDKCPFTTPRLDQMASEGARLTQFYVPTPYCAPSRGTLLTGRYPFRHSVVRNPSPDSGNSNFGLPSSEITIAELLKEHGYATAAIGKWHLGHRQPWLPTTQGFDQYLGILYSNDMFPVQLVRDDRVVEYPVVQATLTQRYTDEAIAFIEANQQNPFFLYLPHAMPHKPLAVSDNFYTPKTPDDLYKDVIAELDASVGRLLDRIDSLGISENTLVIFTSDNGPWYGGSTGGLRGMKGKTWEGGLRVPMIARMPGSIPKGIINHSPAATIDLLPTVANLTGAKVPQDRVIDGKDLWSLLCSSTSESPHQAIFGMQGTSLATIRVGKWKFHAKSPGPLRFSNLSNDELTNWVDPRGPDGVILLAPFEQAKPTEHPGLTDGDKPKAGMLFDLESDPGEQKDVAAEHPTIVAKLQTQFNEMKAQVPQFDPPESSYLLRQEKGRPRELMRLIGGELRYDRIPTSQKHLLVGEGETPQ